MTHFDLIVHHTRVTDTELATHLVIEAQKFTTWHKFRQEVQRGDCGHTECDATLVASHDIWPKTVGKARVAKAK